MRGEYCRWRTDSACQTLFYPASTIAFTVICINDVIYSPRIIQVYCDAPQETTLEWNAQRTDEKWDEKL